MRQIARQAGSSEENPGIYRLTHRLVILLVGKTRSKGPPPAPVPTVPEVLAVIIL